ncbi:MAG: SDR family oxidoreductase [Myxococcota bacterium]
MVVDIVGSASAGLLLDVDEATWERDFAVNLKQHLFVGRAAARNWIDHERAGVLCVVASVSGLFSSARHGAYGAAKAGVLSFVRTAAEVVAARHPRERRRARRRRTHGGGVGGGLDRDRPTSCSTVAMPEDIAGAIAFFVSDLSRKVTGRSIVVDELDDASYRLTP